MNAELNAQLRKESPFISRARLATALVLCAGLWCLHIAWRNKTAPFERNESADVSWIETGHPYLIRCAVLGKNSMPLSGRQVFVKNGSGGCHATTGSDGWADLAMGEPEVNGISIDNVEVLSRPTMFANLKPTCVKGLVVIVVLKGQ